MRGTKEASPQVKRLDIVPVILAGGMGMRLRPLTHPLRPKPFLKLFSKNSLFQETLQRCLSFAPPVVVGASSFAPQFFEQSYEAGVKLDTIIGEPAQRGTAIAIACAALHLKDHEGWMCVMPSDHAVEKPDALFAAIEKAARLPHEFVLIGAPPRAMSSRYGHIVCDGAGDVVRFAEKPARSRIPALAKEGRVLWNTGIFLCQPAVFLGRLKKLQPELYSLAERAMDVEAVHEGFVFPDADAYMAARSVSVDVSVMEHVSNAAVVPIDGAWSDVGTLGAFFHESITRMTQFILNLFT